MKAEGAGAHATLPQTSECEDAEGLLEVWLSVGFSSRCRWPSVYFSASVIIRLLLGLVAQSCDFILRTCRQPQGSPELIMSSLPLLFACKQE